MISSPVIIAAARRDAGGGFHHVDQRVMAEPAARIVEEQAGVRIVARLAARGRLITRSVRSNEKLTLCR
jgi:hypothetical protein